MTGEVLWSRRYARTGSSHETLFGIDVDSQGNALLTGRFSVTDTNDDFVVIKLNGYDGDVEWVESFDGGDQRVDRSWAITVGPDDNPVITGITVHDDDSASYFTRKLSGANGDEIWTRIIPGAISSEYERAGWLELTTNGDLVMLNRTWSTTTSYDVVLYRFAGDDGHTIWDTQYNAGGTNADNPMNMSQDSDGNLLVVGVSAGDFMVLKFDVSNGDLIWAGEYDGPPGWYDTAKAVTTGPAGEVIVGGFSDGSGTSWDMTTVGFDPTDGNEIWHLRHDGATQSDETNGLAVSSEGDLYLVGYTTDPASGSDLCCLRYGLGEFSAVEPLPPAALRIGPGNLAAAPNPFSPMVVLSYRLPISQQVRLVIHTIDGRRVATLFDGMAEPGNFGATWTGTNSAGETMPSGVYYARLEMGTGSLIQKLILTR